MSKLYQSGDRYFFWCPGCKEPHFFQTAGTPAWQFNADLENPTFSPSLVNITRRGDRDHTCHLFLIQGNIQFAADCSHEYRAQTVPLPDWEREENAMHRTIRKAKEDEMQASTPPPATAPAPKPLPCFLEVADHVVPGLEDREVVIAKDQPQYKPLAALPAGDERGTVLSRWTFDDDARAAVARGADLYLEVLTFGHPFQPTVMFVHEKLDKQIVLEGYFAPAPSPSPTSASDLSKKAAAASAPGAGPEPAEPSDEKQTVEEAHEPHHIQCRTCGVWYNKNDAGCPNCGTRTPIVVGG